MVLGTPLTSVEDLLGWAIEKNTGICPVKLYQSQCNTGMHFVKNYLMAKLWQNCPTINNNAGFMLLDHGGGPINTIIRAAAYSILEHFGDKCI